MDEKPRIIIQMNVDHEDLKAGERYEVDSDQAADLVKQGLANFSTQTDVTQVIQEKVEGKPEQKEKEPKIEPKTEAPEAS